MGSYCVDGELSPVLCDDLEGKDVGIVFQKISLCVPSSLENVFLFLNINLFILIGV